ncbi:hypothetical protein ACLB2K_053361 [Fragaria x ananassa]
MATEVGIEAGRPRDWSSDVGGLDLGGCLDGVLGQQGSRTGTYLAEVVGVGSNRAGSLDGNGRWMLKRLGLYSGLARDF